MHDYIANPWFLLLLPLVPYIVWRWLQRPRPALRYPDTGLLAALPPGRSRRAHRFGILLRAAALGCLVLGMAGLRWPDHSSRLPTEGIALMMLVDVSGSMAEPDFDWSPAERISRLEAVKRAFRLFVVGGDGPDGQHLEGRPTDLIGLVPFAARPTLDDCPLTLSHSVLLHALDRMKPERVPGEAETNLSDAIVLGLQHLHHGDCPRKVMVLLTDGEHNRQDPASELTPLQAAQMAANLNVPVYTIDAGGPAEVGDGDSATKKAVDMRKAGIQSLKDVAHITKGQSFRAHDARALLEVCRTIDGLERQRIESYQYRNHYEAYPWLGLSAFALWLVVTVLELTTWRRLPL